MMHMQEHIPNRQEHEATASNITAQTKKTTTDENHVNTKDTGKASHPILNHKQKNFVQAYAAGQNGYDAAVYAGYSPASAKATARRLLENPEIQIALQSLKNDDKNHEKLNPKPEYTALHAENSPTLQNLAKDSTSEGGISKEAVVRELAAIGFASMNDICSWSEDGVTLHHSDDIPQDARAAIAEVRESGTARGGVLVKLHPKLRALEMLGRHLGMFNSAQLGTDQGHNSMAFDAAQALFNDTDTTLPKAVLHKLNAVYGTHGRASCGAKQSKRQSQADDSPFSHDYNEDNDFDDEDMELNYYNTMN